ncbi:ABC transporter permease [Clostridium tyrobutyricum]|jgi:ABC-2 type transport system permease protein|uniref:ABC transporter permease n=1 Tax=Clostridium tyrobutyricum TaxID=1519 RepID=UPI0011C74A04|nr:ABC transporter permease [Clostridium tyrobutyricum]MBV4419166.1 ABC transporter permease [Clostridium tyrobutyricum]
MTNFKTSLINELEKLYKKKKAMVAVALSLIFIVFGQIFISVLRNNFGVQGVSSSEFPLLILSIIINTLLPLFIALITIDSFSGEFSQNTMKITLTRPVSRFKLYLSKILSIFIFAFSILILCMILSTISGIIFNLNSFNFLDVSKIILSYIVTILPVMILCLIIVILTNILKSGIAVFFLSILIFIAFKALEIFFPSYSGILFTSMFGWYNLWIMDGIPLFKIFRDFMMILSYDIILFTAGYYIFDKRDF